MDWWIVVMSLGYLAFMGWVIQIFAHYKISKSKQRSEERLRLLERFGTSQELVDFLESEAGERLLAALSARPSDPRTKIAGGFAAGLVVLFLGFGFLLLAGIEDFGDPDPLLIPGVLFTFAGLAVLLSSALALRWWKLGALRGRDALS